MKILNLTTAIPSRYGTGADIASNHLIDAMRSLGHEVTVVGYRRQGDRHAYGKDTIEVKTWHIETKSAGFTPISWGMTALTRKLPYTSAKYYSKPYLQEVRALLSQQSYDGVVLEHSSQLGWLKPVIGDRAKVAVFAHNLEHEIYQERHQNTNNLLARWIYRREATLVKQVEDDLATTSGAVWALSAYDADYFNRLGQTVSTQVLALPSSVTQPVAIAHPKTYDIGMVGSWIWKPNADGLRYFFDHIYPHLPAHLSIRVAGRGAEWLAGRYANVEYVGFVEDAQKFLAEARAIAIASIRGGGVQLKTLEAIGLALPVVATPFALRGIPTLPTTVQSAATPEQFAEALQRAIAQPLTEADLESVKDWVQGRYRQFLGSVETALQTLTH